MPWVGQRMPVTLDSGEGPALPTEQTSDGAAPAPMKVTLLKVRVVAEQPSVVQSEQVRVSAPKSANQCCSVVYTPPVHVVLPAERTQRFCVVLATQLWPAAHVLVFVAAPQNVCVVPQLVAGGVALPARFDAPQGETRLVPPSMIATVDGRTPSGFVAVQVPDDSDQAQVPTGQSLRTEMLSMVSLPATQSLLDGY